MTSLTELSYSPNNTISPNYNTSNGFGTPAQSSRRFTAVSRKDPCPICGKDHGCARTQDGAVLCRREPGSFGETLNGYKCIRERGSKEHSMWKPSEEWVEGRQYQPQYVNEPVKEGRQYSAEERNSFNRQIVDQLTLLDKHRQHLLKRGLSPEAIEKNMYRSVVRNQEVDLELPEDFPGGSGNKLHIYRDGILIPMRDARGNITGFQYRPDSPGTGGKYLMVSKESRISINGELPITVIKGSDKEFYHTAHITEGSLKPAVASDMHGFELTIGAIGYSPNLLAETLSELGVQRVIICPDGGDVRNEAVMNKWSKVVELLKALETNWGGDIEVQVVWYGQTTKDDDDIDEIPSLDGTRLITPDEFLQKAPNKRYDPNFRQEFTPTVKTSEVIIPAARVVHVRAGMGAGKTQKSLEIAKQHVAEGGRIVYITHRNSLARQFMARAEEQGINIIHVLDDPLLARDRDANMACCVDSLHRIVKDIDENTLVIIDETLGFLEHTRTNKTSRELERVLTMALRNCGRIITMDAHITDLASNTIDILSGKGKSVKVLVETPLNKFPIKLVTGRGKQHESIKAGDNLLVVTDSKGYAKKTKHCAIAWGLREEQILLVTSETIKEQNVIRFMSDPDGELSRHQYKLVICSPSCESGLSIQVKGYFERVCALFVGVVTVETAVQMLGRLRDPVPRFIECRPKGVGAVDYDTLEGKQSRLQALFNELKGMVREGDEVNFDSIVEYTINSEKAFMEYDAITDFLVSTSKCHYLDNVLSFLRQLGYDVDSEIEGADPYIEQAVKKIHHDYDLEQAQKLRDATPYDSIQEATSIQAPTENQNLRIQKTFLEDSNPGLVDICSDDALVEVMNNKPTVNAVNRYMAVKTSNEKPVLAVTEEMGQTMSAPDLVRNKKSDAIKSILYTLGSQIDALLQVDRYCYKSKEAKDLLEAAKPYALALGIKPRYSPNQAIRTILELMGCKTRLVDRCREDGKQVRYYTVVTALSQELHYKVVKTNKWVVSASQETGPDLVPPPLDSYINNISMGGVAHSEIIPPTQPEPVPPPLDSYINNISEGGVSADEPAGSILDSIRVENHSLVYKLVYDDPGSGLSIEALGYHIVDAVKSLGKKLTEIGIILSESDYDALILQG